jgi:eukaryotic-like serine/threonine-protein kinase
VLADPGDRVGSVIGRRFRVDALIGRGAMAEVYHAHDLEGGDAVALKILRRSLAGDPAIAQRFSREAEVQAKLRHRNVAALLATGVTDANEPYLVVELLRGNNLRHAIKTEGRLAPRRAASYAWQALQGLGAVHQNGVLHRDLKPANMMLEPSPGPFARIVLIDFGFAALEGTGAARLTAQGTIVGSLTYVAPERLRGELPDRRSDLYAIGVILFEMLSGAPPFVAESDLALVELQLEAPPPPLDPGVAQPLRDVVGIALSKQPADRYPSAAAMAAAIEDAARQLG